jgi:hypothetical protein
MYLYIFRNYINETIVFRNSSIMQCRRCDKPVMMNTKMIQSVYMNDLESAVKNISIVLKASHVDRRREFLKRAGNTFQITNEKLGCLLQKNLGDTWKVDYNVPDSIKLPASDKGIWVQDQYSGESVEDGCCIVCWNKNTGTIAIRYYDEYGNFCVDG